MATALYRVDKGLHRSGIFALLPRTVTVAVPSLTAVKVSPRQNQ